jgi:hypothetical protein
MWQVLVHVKALAGERDPQGLDSVFPRLSENFLLKDKHHISRVWILCQMSHIHAVFMRAVLP